MTKRRGISFPSVLGCTVWVLIGCSGNSTPAGSTGGTPGTQTGGAGTGGTTTAATGGERTGGQSMGATGGSATGGQATGGNTPVETGGVATGGQVGGSAAGGSASGGTMVGTGGATARTGGTSVRTGGTTARTGGTAVTGGTPTQTGGSVADGGVTGPCVGKDWTTADPTVAGPFAVASEKNVGPAAGALPDPVYGNEQQHFNIYRPKDLATSGYCHPILVWANGHGDNPEQNPPKCIVNQSTNTWCGTYPMLMNQLASHGFVVIASLSTTTSQGNPLPTIVGLNWLLEQAEDPSSAYYHRLDTAHIGALGHSEGGMSTCKAASDPRIKAIATVCGTSTISGLGGPALFICGDKDTVAKCDGIRNNFLTVKNQPAMFINNLASDHGSWLGQNGAKGPTIFGLTAWFRAHLMGDTENRKRFYGASCTFCSDSRVKVEQNSLMTQ